MATGFFLAYKDKEKSPIDVIVRFKKIRLKRATGESVRVNMWNAESQQCRETKDYPRGKAINAKLKQLFKACNTVCDKHIAESTLPDNSKMFWRDVDFILNNGVVDAELYFLEYAKGSFMQRLKASKSEETIKKYVTTINKLMQFEGHTGIRLKFKDFNNQFYFNFERFMYSQNYSANYFGSIIKCIKVVFREAREIDELHTLRGVEHRDFKAIAHTADTIYLSEDELLRMHNLEFTQELLANYYPDIANQPQAVMNKIKCYNIVRAKFLIGAFTALRVSDFNRLENINLNDGFITIRTQKTGTKVIIPIHWVIREILEAGFDMTQPISDQKLNQHIKEIARIAGITQQVEITKNIGGRNKCISYEKCDLITNHTARRSAATNMFKAGIPTISIMKITGHTTEKSFLKYIKITAEENALLLAKHSFFAK